MSGTVRRAIIVIAASVLLQVGVLAAVDVVYQGETPVSGINGVIANNLWDYMYDLTVTPNGPSVDGGPFWFAVQCDYQPVTVYPLPDPHGALNYWVGSWSPSVTYLGGAPGVLWTWVNDQTTQPIVATFHFTSTWAPALRPWVAEGNTFYGDTYRGSGIEWSASPEPASMALTGLCLFGVAAWKRRKMGLKKD